jgi:Probable cobalt transporter subunit (CbtB)
MTLSKIRDTEMSVIIKQVAKERSDVPKVAIGILVGIFVLSMFVVGYDQGQLVQALVAPMGIHLNHDQLMFIHEFNHDLRHAAGFPCH